MLQRRECYRHEDVTDMRTLQTDLINRRTLQTGKWYRKENITDKKILRMVEEDAYVSVSYSNNYTRN